MAGNYIRREYNGILLDKASGSNNLVQEKYITVSVAKRSIEEARTFFARVGTDLTAGLGRMDSGIREITLNERLRLFHDFFRVGQESAFAFDLQTAQRRGHDYRDAIAPEALSAIGRSHGCQFATTKLQQEDALNTVLPYGLRRIDAMRTLTTESTAVPLPFKTQEIMDTGGLYYGVNAVSRNLIICNRDAMLNGHGLYMCVSGSGKSMMAKQEIGFVGLNTNHDIIVVDPEREYGPLIRALGGEVITISASNGSYVNALDISKEYGDGHNPLVLKSEFIMSLCEQLMGAGEISAKEKSIIDRCTANIYRKYMEQHANCVAIEWGEVQPGDLLFYPEDEHVGIAAGRDWLGRLLVVHCASGTGGVAISHRTSFETAARPVWYEDE